MSKTPSENYKFKLFLTFFSVTEFFNTPLPLVSLSCITSVLSSSNPSGLTSTQYHQLSSKVQLGKPFINPQLTIPLLFIITYNSG